MKAVGQDHGRMLPEPLIEAITIKRTAQKIPLPIGQQG